MAAAAGPDEQRLQAALARIERVLAGLSLLEPIDDRVAALETRQLRALQRLDALDGDAPQHLADRQLQLLASISDLEVRVGLSNTAASTSMSATQERLSSELTAMGITNFSFVRCPPDYYDRTLEERRDILGAASTACLCKTIVMENTKARADVVDCANAANSRYYMMITQYVSALNTTKVKAYVHAMANANLAAGETIGTKFFGFRLAPGEVNDSLSGYTHNAVSPVGFKTAEMPIIMSKAAADQQRIWIGGGEVDLKLGLNPKDFIRAYKPFVVDC